MSGYRCSVTRRRKAARSLVQGQRQAFPECLADARLPAARSLAAIASLLTSSIPAPFSKVFFCIFLAKKIQKNTLWRWRELNPRLASY